MPGLLGSLLPYKEVILGAKIPPKMRARFEKRSTPVTRCLLSRHNPGYPIYSSLCFSRTPVKNGRRPRYLSLRVPPLTLIATIGTDLLIQRCPLLGRFESLYTVTIQPEADINAPVRRRATLGAFCLNGLLGARAMPRAAFDSSHVCSITAGSRR